MIERAIPLNTDSMTFRNCAEAGRGAATVANVLPPDLAPLARRGASGEPSKIRCHGTPFFTLIVDQKVIV